MRKFFDFKGRLNRKQYLMMKIIFTILAILPVGIISSTIDHEYHSDFAFALSGLAMFAVAVIFGWAYLSIICRRLHDIDMSGWHQTWLLIPGTINLLILPSHNMAAALPFALADACVGLFLLLKRGSQGSNAYGPAQSGTAMPIGADEAPLGI